MTVVAPGNVILDIVSIIQIEVKISCRGGSETLFN